MKEHESIQKKNKQAVLEELIGIAIEKDASDIHISVGHYPIIRTNGQLTYLEDKGKIGSEDSRELAMVMMTEEQKKYFSQNLEVDFSYTYKDSARLRVNVFMQRGEVSCSMRLIPRNIKTIEDLEMPPITYNFCNSNQGFVLVTGPTGHGKSTTLAAMINYINRNKFSHIITIEDPVEYIFEDEKSLIDQREVGEDARSFSSALRAAFRQDPDVIMVGEMRDPETITMAITAAETGHLVFSTLHTNSASQTIHRIIDSFPPEQQNQIRAQLSASLKGVISKRLIPGINGGIVPAYEIMMTNPAIANLIRENRTHEINRVIETSAEEGMISMNKSLLRLAKKQKISTKNALTYSPLPEELRKMME